MAISPRIGHFPSKAFLTLLSLLFTHAQAWSNPQTIQGGANFIDTTHDEISNRILSLSNRIDSFFGDPRIDDESNNSRVRVFNQTNFREAETAENEVGYKIQLRLPKTEKRLQLVIQQDEDEEEPGQTSSTAAAQRNEGAREDLADKSTAGLRYILDVADIKLSSDAGLRLNLPPQAFVRFRFRKNMTFGEWAFRPVEKLLWVDREGWYSQTDLNFDRRINDTWLFRFVNNLTWDDQDYILRTQNGPSFFQKVSEITGINYSAYVYSQDTPSWAVQNYVLSLGFRQLIYKEWFFWEITPSLSFPREERFHRTPGLSIRFEAIFGSV